MLEDLGKTEGIHPSDGFVRSYTCTSPSLPGTENKFGACLGNPGEQQKGSWP